MNFIKGLEHGFAGLAGVGEYANPLGDLKSKLGGMKDDLQEIKNQGEWQLASDSEQNIKNNLKYSVAMKKTMEETMAYFHTVSMDNQEETNYFLILLALLVIIIIFFMIIR